MRKRIEAALGRSGRFVYRRAWWVIAIISLVLATGFLVYSQAYRVNLIACGILIATAIVLAFVSDVTLAPALVTSLAKKRERDVAQTA